MMAIIAVVTTTVVLVHSMFVIDTTIVEVVLMKLIVVCTLVTCMFVALPKCFLFSSMSVHNCTRMSCVMHARFSAVVIMHIYVCMYVSLHTCHCTLIFEIFIAMHEKFSIYILYYYCESA